MKKKLTRSSFSALRETATLLNEKEQRAVIGGDYWDDHGIWQLDSNGNSYWTRTSQGDGYYYGDSGYYGGSGYYGDSNGNYGSNSGYGSSYPGFRVGDCVVQSIAYMFGLDLQTVHREMSLVIQELYGYSSTVSDILAGQNAYLEQIHALMTRVGGSCYVSSYNVDSQLCALGLAFGHAVVLEEYDVSTDTYKYVDPQDNYSTGTIAASKLEWVITAD
jgi:hypothetical protein